MDKKEKNKLAQQRYREKHRDKILARRKQWRIDNKEKLKKDYWERGKDYDLQYRYGISIDEYNKLFQQQGGCCAICNKPQVEMKKSLVVDHDHETGDVRGLLCNECNRALGYFQDDPNIISKSLKYLNKNKG